MQVGDNVWQALNEVWLLLTKGRKISFKVLQDHYLGHYSLSSSAKERERGVRVHQSKRERRREKKRERRKKEEGSRCFRGARLDFKCTSFAFLVF